MKSRGRRGRALPLRGKGEEPEERVGGTVLYRPWTLRCPCCCSALPGGCLRSRYGLSWAQPTTVAHCQEETRPSLLSGRAGFRPSPGSLTPRSSACTPPHWCPLAHQGHSCSCAWALLLIETSWAPTGPVQLPGCDSRGPPIGGDKQAYLADPLGVGAALVTADDFLVFLRRSGQVAEAPGLVDVPGGHPEPQALCPGDSPLHKDLPGELVVHELFSSVLQEICDEVNLPLLTLSQPLLLGIASNETSAGRASAEFYVQCSLTSEQVRKHYMNGGPEAHESTGIIFVETQSVPRLQEMEMWTELCPSAKGAIFLYNRVQGGST